MSDCLDYLSTHKDNFILYSNHSDKPTKQETPARAGEMSTAYIPGLPRGCIRKLWAVPGPQTGLAFFHSVKQEAVFKTLLEINV